jgi:hypothetical protein
VAICYYEYMLDISIDIGMNMNIMMIITYIFSVTPIVTSEMEIHEHLNNDL